MGVPDRPCRECRAQHDGCPVTAVADCLQLKTCATCIHKAPGRFVGMSGSPGIGDATFHGCELLAPFVGVQNSTRACKHYRRTSV